MSSKKVLDLNNPKVVEFLKRRADARAALLDRNRRTRDIWTTVGTDTAQRFAEAVLPVLRRMA